MLAGNWRNANGSCTAVFSEHGNIEISYASARFSRGYGITQLGPVVGIVGIGMMGVGMMGMQRHEGESLRFSLDGLCLTNGNEDIFRIDCAWYADGDAKLHVELTDLRSGQKWHHVLTRDVEAGTARASSDADTFTCECGYQGPARKFCPECGKSIERHTCECGFVSIGAKFCPNCGKPTKKMDQEKEVQEKEVQEKKVLEKKELLFSISMSMSTNPPRTDGAQVYAHSETELVLERGGDQRLISADILKPAYEIIRKNRLDDPEFKDPAGGAIMGGTANVGFKNGDQWINASMYDKGNAALSAYYELMGLFQNAG